LSRGGGTSYRVRGGEESYDSGKDQGRGDNAQSRVWGSPGGPKKIKTEPGRGKDRKKKGFRKAVVGRREPPSRTERKLERRKGSGGGKKLEGRMNEQGRPGNAITIKGEKS